MTHKKRIKQRNFSPTVRVQDVQDTEHPQVNKPTIEKGNYLIQVISDGREIKQVVAIGAEINIIKLAEGGLAIDLK